MKDYTLIKKTWKGKLIRHIIARKSLENVNISEENKHLLQEVGLPVMLHDDLSGFLPFTFIPSLEVQGKEYYLLADAGLGMTGTSLLALEKTTEEIFIIWLQGKQRYNCMYVNQSLYQYLMCLAHYTNFITTDYPEISPESCKPSVYRGKIQVRADYQQLKDNLTSIDAKVMAEPNSFWASEVFGIQVNGWGDYFCDIDYDTYEPTFTPEEQEAMDKRWITFLVINFLPHKKHLRLSFLVAAYFSYLLLPNKPKKPNMPAKQPREWVGCFTLSFTPA